MKEQVGEITILRTILRADSALRARFQMEVEKLFVASGIAVSASAIDVLTVAAVEELQLGQAHVIAPPTE